MNQGNFEKLSDVIKKAEKEIITNLEHCQGFNKVILLGNTGSGKTTVSCILACKEVMIRKTGRNNITLDYKGIESGGKSITKIPSIMINKKHDLLIGDCPGFQDTEGTQQEIVNAFSIDCLLTQFSNNYNKVKILLVIGVEEILAGRAQAVTQIFERMEKMFTIKEQLEQGVGVIFTRSDSDKEGIDFIDMLNVNASPIVKKWCTFFENHIDRVFTLPKPHSENINKVYDFYDRERLISFTKKDQIVNPIHSVTLSKNATDDLGNEYFKNCQYLNDTISSIFEAIYEQFNKETSSKKLKKWSGILMRFKNIEIQNTKDLIRIIVEYLPNKSIFTDYVESLTNFEPFDSFINKVLKVKNNGLQRFFRKKTVNAIIQLESNRKYVQSIEAREKEIECQKLTLAKQEEMTNNIREQLNEQKQLTEEYKNETELRFYEQEQKFQKLIEENKILSNYEKLERAKPKGFDSSLWWSQYISELNKDDLIGILRSLTTKTGGNIHDNGTIIISSNSINGPNFEPKNLVDFNSKNCYASKTEYDSYVRFDFLDQKIQLQSYLIKTPPSPNDKYYLKNWVVEVSNDTYSWTEIDYHENNIKSLKGEGRECIFNVSKTNELYRYVQIRQNKSDCIFCIAEIDFYGKLYIP